MEILSPVVAPCLWDFQTSTVEELRRRIKARETRILLVAPTGSGKGTLSAHMVAGAQAKGKRVIFLVNRRELVKDMSRRLHKLGVRHGVIMANHGDRRPWELVHIASIDTLARRDVMPSADLIFVDEAHFAVSPKWKTVLDQYPGVPVIFMTATPIRADGRGLSEIAQSIYVGPSVAELTRRGFLVPARIFAPLPAQPDLDGVKTQKGEFNQVQLAEAVDKARLIGDIVGHWQRLGQGRPTVCFAVNCKHSNHIVEQFLAAGIRAVHVDANTEDDIRDKTWKQLANGEVQVVSSVGIISYGWDVPPVSCAILARPTKSVALYLQQVGRVLRTHESKTDALVLDHAGACLQHGFPDDVREWTLDGIRRKQRGPQDSAIAVRMCKACWCAYPSSAAECPACRVPAEKREIIPEHDEGELTEITAANRPTYVIKKLSANPEKARLQKIAAEKGYKPGWVWYQTQQLEAEKLIQAAR